jgi:hypothetical protein
MGKLYREIKPLLPVAKECLFILPHLSSKLEVL